MAEPHNGQPDKSIEGEVSRLYGKMEQLAPDELSLFKDAIGMAIDARMPAVTGSTANMSMLREFVGLQVGTELLHGLTSSETDGKIDERKLDGQIVNPMVDPIRKLVLERAANFTRKIQDDREITSVVRRAFISKQVRAVSNNTQP